MLLTILLVKPVFEPRDSYAAKKIEYKVVNLPDILNSSKSPDTLFKELNKYGAEGWELVLYKDEGVSIFIRR